MFPQTMGRGKHLLGRDCGTAVLYGQAYRCWWHQTPPVRFGRL